MDKFMEDCMKIAASSEMDGLVKQLTKNKKETDKHVNKFLDNMSYQNMDEDSKQQLRELRSSSTLK